MKIGVIGASGYAGGELLRLLAGHPEFEVCTVTAHSNAGETITSVHPQLVSYAGKKFSAFAASDFDCCELIFLALPHGESAKVIASLNPKAKIVDLGADYRLEDPVQWQKYYGGNHAGAWVYGLPELTPGQREAIKKESKVANPGCYATSISLGIAPAVGAIDVSDIAKSKIELLDKASLQLETFSPEIMKKISDFKSKYNAFDSEIGSNPARTG
mgnify:CR=1 FL=1